MSRVGRRGEITIEKRIRDELGIEPGWLGVQERVGDRLVIRFHAPGNSGLPRRAVAKHARRAPSSDQS